MSTAPLPPTERWYAWRVLATVEGEAAPRLLVPHADPDLYEDPIDHLYRDAAEAHRALADWGVAADAVAENWVLCHVTVVPVGRVDPARLPAAEEVE